MTLVRNLGLSVAFGCLVLGCAPKDAVSGFHDPYESSNRRTHALNKAIDTNILRPLDGGETAKPLGQAVQNFSDNLSLPNVVANDLLQARPDQAVVNTLRFGLNSTIGLAGLFDPAAALGLAEKDNDFGHTLHVWGMGEGAFVEVPFFGPSTERDVLGDVVDLFLDPLGPYLSADQKAGRFALGVVAKVAKRNEFGGTVDSILYESADSYAQARLLYLQNRRYELGQTTATEADFLDPYEDPYAE